MFLWGCESFSWGYCITCKHSWSQHYNDKYIFERVKKVRKIPLDNSTKNTLEESSKCIDHVIDVLENELIEKEHK